MFFFFQSLWWERRVFPLKDEDKDALCQDEKHNENERSSPILPGEVFCTFTSDNSHHPKSHTDGMDYRTFGLGLTYVKKNRWQGSNLEKTVYFNGKGRGEEKPSSQSLLSSLQSQSQSKSMYACTSILCCLWNRQGMSFSFLNRLFAKRHVLVICTYYANQKHQKSTAEVWCQILHIHIYTHTLQVHQMIIALQWFIEIASNILEYISVCINIHVYIFIYIYTQICIYKKRPLAMVHLKMPIWTIHYHQEMKTVE